MGQILVIPADSTLEIKTPLDTTIFDLIQMGDNSVLKISVDTKLQAIEARFGTKCLIDGSASSDPPPTPARPDGYGVPAGQCDSGLGGAGGAGGASGSAGRNIKIEIGLSEIGSLEVRSNGQPGGDGAPGGSGQQGGGAKCILCRGGGGGPGGTGGTGGRGGNSGAIVFSWSPLGSLADAFAALDKDAQEGMNTNALALANIVLTATPGRPGRGGAGGEGGRGGDGADCGLYGQMGGDPGGHGAQGSSGSSGTRVQPVLVKT